MNPRPLRLRDIQAITFDCYGTLIDWEAGAQQTLRLLLARKNARTEETAFFRAWERAQRARIQQDYAPYREIAAETFREVAERLNLPLGAREATEFADSIAHWQPFSDAPPGLVKLKQKLALGIISNIDDDILRESVRQLDVDFDLLMTAEQARAYKPSPAPFQRALEKLRLPANLVAHAAFGFEYDITTAGELGFRTILVRRMRTSFPSTPVPDLVVTDLRDLAAQFD